MNRPLIAILCAVTLLYPTVALGSELEPEIDIQGGVGASGTVADANTAKAEFLADLVEVPSNEVPAEVLAEIEPGERLFAAPPGLSIGWAECFAVFGNCEAVTVVTEREVFLTDDEGNRIDAEDSWRLDTNGLIPGISATGSSSAYRWNWSDTIEYFGVMGTTWVHIGDVRATYKVTLSGRHSEWKQSTDKWAGPSIKAKHRWNCVDDNGNLPNSSCTGGWQVNEDTTYRGGIFWSQDNVYHSQVETYWYDFRVDWKAYGWTGWGWGLGPWSTHKFDCPSGQSCEF